MLGAILGGAISAASSLFGAKTAQKNAEKQSAQEYARQKEFAQSGVQWKVEDAKKAGIAPLAALGGSTLSYSPQSIGNFDSGIGNAGQDISRAVQAAASPGQRTDAYTRTAQAIELERGTLQNQLLRSQIAKLNQPGHGPGIAVDSEGYTIPGQPNSGIPGVLVGPSKTTTVTPHVPYEQAGTVPDVHYAQTADGGYAPIPSAAVKQQIEDQMLPEFGWAMRNMVFPSISSTGHPPTHIPRPWSKEWYYDVGNQNYKLRTRASNQRYRDYFTRK